MPHSSCIHSALVEQQTITMKDSKIVHKTLLAEKLTLVINLINPAYGVDADVFVGRNT